MFWSFKDLQEAGIDPAEAKVLYSFLLDQFRRNRAVVFPEMVSPNDEVFAPQNQQGGFWIRKPAGLEAHPRGYSLKGWLPAGTSLNTRLDYLDKILSASGMENAQVEAEKLLNNLWLTLIDQRSPLLSLFG